MRARLRLTAAVALAAGLAWGCAPSDEPADEGAMLSLDEVMAGPPAWEAAGPVRVWAAEKQDEMGVYYVLSHEDLGPIKQDKAAVRLVLLKGRAELKVGDVAKASGPGAYATAPPGSPWSLKRLGHEPLVFSLLVSPDAVAPAELLRPAARGDIMPQSP